jgi:ubiquinone/menaquinone biosynthesis C-methylase UbiE
VNDLGHSEEYFGDYRTDWWNQDFLDLMFRRWNLSGVSKVLDVGCGIGHWSKELFRLLPSTARIMGLDADPKWVNLSKEWIGKTQYRDRFESKAGSADNLPFEDGIFDVVTCQTVLIHIKDIPKVLSEFKRVLKPGGLFIAAEPNNIASYLVKSSLTSNASIDDLLKEIKFALICERGKVALGEGDNSAGDLVPGFAANIGFEDIKVFLSDKASPLYAPYQTQEQQNLIAQFESTSQGKYEAQVLSYLEKQYIAGGGTKADFDLLNQENCSEFLTAIKNKTYHSAGGVIMYLISARKPVS